MPETGLTLLPNIGMASHQPTEYPGQVATEHVQQLDQFYMIQLNHAPATAFEALFAELPTVEF